jgi:hypothetical protein
LHPTRRQLRNRHGGHARAILNLVAPLAASVATDTRATDTAGQLDLFSSLAASGAVVPPIGPDPEGLRHNDVARAIDRSTPATTPTPGTRASTTATRTTGTRTTRTWRARSAGRTGEGLSLAALLEAWLDCRRHKRNTASAREFEARQEEELAGLHADLASGAYRPGPSTCFVITRPKPREVWAAGFRDRVVHHALYNRIGPRFEASFIADTCACIKGRGTLYGARRLEAKVRAITANWTRRAYYLKLDVANFFVSIDKRILLPLLERRVHEPFWMDLAELIVAHDPRENVIVRGRADELARIPPAKSLFRQDAHHGLPIGNLSSQFFANVYLDPLDQHVKHQLRAPHYVRYVDDFILLHEDPRQLNAWRAAIERFLEERLQLRLNPAKAVLQPIARGVDFVGQVVKPWRRTIRRRTVHATLTRISSMPAEDVPAAANSYFGLLRQASHSAHDRARLARAVLRRGVAVDQRLMKAYP